MKHVHQFSVDGLVVFDGFDKRHIYNLIVINANHHVTLTFEQCLDAGCTIIDLTPEERQQFMDAVVELNATEGAPYKDILDKIAAMQ